MGFFYSPPKLYSAKQMRFSKAKNSGVMRDLLGKKGMGNVLDKKVEKEEFYKVLRKKSGAGGVTLNTLRETLGDFRMGRGKSIDTKEAKKLAEILIPKQGFFTKRYIFSPEEKSKEMYLFKWQEKKASDRNNANSKASAPGFNKPKANNSLSNLKASPHFTRTFSKIAKIA